MSLEKLSAKLLPDTYTLYPIPIPIPIPIPSTLYPIMLSRRHFLTITTMTATQAVFNSLQAFAKPLTVNAQTGFNLLIFATNWGYTNSWANFASKIKQLGYDGAELWFPSDAAERKEIFSAFKGQGLKMGFLIGGSDQNFQKHLDQFAS